MKPVSYTSPDAIRTKTVATVGPACREVEMLRRLIAKGVDVFRINTAHGNREEHAQLIEAIRAAAAQAGHVVGILLDLAGPKMRLGKLVEDPLECPLNAEFLFLRRQQATASHELTCSYEQLIDEVEVGDEIMLADGTVGMRVVEKQLDSARCRVFEAGLIRSRQGVNLPGVALSVATMTPHDLQYAQWAAENGIDFVSLSFVRQHTEIVQLKELLRQQGSSAMVIAKIEKREALANLEEIVRAADGIMVARGDLGVEIDVAETPMAQKRIIQCCKRWGKPVIVATQMLDSMQQSRRPTRAEATDVANAIIDGSDACMLSGETAIGRYPEEAVEMMNRIMAITERAIYDGHSPEVNQGASSVHAITSSVISGANQIAFELKARLVVVVSRSGATALVKSKLRGWIPTVGVSDNPGTLRQMCLFWGITPIADAPVVTGPELREFITRRGVQEGWLEKGDRIVFVGGSGIAPQSHNLVVVHEV